MTFLEGWKSRKDDNRVDLERERKRDFNCSFCVCFCNFSTVLRFLLE